MKASPETIYEDNHLLVIFKPSGWLSQGDRTGDPSVLDWAKEYLKNKYNKPGNVFIGLPHRLDRPVSGVMVLARTSKSLERLNNMFRNNQVSKTYHALVTGKPSKTQDLLRNWLIKDPGTNSSKVVKKTVQKAKEAVLEYSWEESIGNYSILNVQPETGRPHQIRVQLANMGCPIVGDIKYGGISVDEYRGSIGLHASKIQFIHPVQKELVFFEASYTLNSIFAMYTGT